MFLMHFTTNITVCMPQMNNLKIHVSVWRSAAELLQKYAVGVTKYRWTTSTGIYRATECRWTTSTRPCRPTKCRWTTSTGSCRPTKCRWTTSKGVCRPTKWRWTTSKGTCRPTRCRWTTSKALWQCYVVFLKNCTIDHFCAKLTQNAQKYVNFA